MTVVSALTSGDGGADDNDARGGRLVTAPLTTRPWADNEAQESRLVATFDPRQVTSGANRSRVEPGAPSNTLHGSGMGVVVGALTSTNSGYRGRMSAEQAAAGHVLPVGAFGVRRLTPRETERLQGFPDDWTAWGLDANGRRRHMSDSARYGMTGNAVAVPVVEWIARRLLEVDAAD